LVNKRDQRLKDFWLRRHGMDRLSTDELRERLRLKKFNGGQVTLAKQILKERGDSE
jgi:hypothetical protein